MPYLQLTVHQNIESIQLETIISKEKFKVKYTNLLLIIDIVYL